MIFINFILFILKKQKVFKSNSKIKQQILDNIKYIQLLNLIYINNIIDIIIKILKFDNFKIKINATNKNFSRCLTIKNKYIIIYKNDKKKHCGKFKYCLNLKTIILDTIEISNCTFQNCISLETIFLKNTKYIRSQSFINCISLKIIYIPKDIQIIEINSFKNCLNLTKIIFY